MSNQKKDNKGAPRVKLDAQEKPRTGGNELDFGEDWSLGPEIQRSGDAGAGRGRSRGVTGRSAPGKAPGSGADPANAGSGTPVPEEKPLIKLSLSDENGDPEKSGGKPAGSAGKKKKKKKRRGRRHKKPMTVGRVLVRILIVILVLLAAAAAALAVMRMRGRAEMMNQTIADGTAAPEELDVTAGDDGTIIYNGEKFKYNTNLINILLMGIDREGDMIDLHAVEGQSSGQADTLFVLSIDTKTGKSQLLNISRDAMADVDQYNYDGKYTGTEKMQACLAYAFGDGGKLSAENEGRTVSRLLYGVPIHAYAGLDLDGIAPLNDSVDGVQVEVLEDLSNRDKELVKGAVVTLLGDQAETYVRARNGDHPDPEIARESNNMRMARQRQYLTNYIQQVRQKVRSDLQFPVKLYRTLSQYMVTSVDVSQAAYLASVFLTHRMSGAEIQVLPGEAVDGEEYTEFHVNSKEAFVLTLKMFYDKV